MDIIHKTSLTYIEHKQIEKITVNIYLIIQNSVLCVEMFCKYVTDYKKYHAFYDVYYYYCIRTKIYY